MCEAELKRARSVRNYLPHQQLLRQANASNVCRNLYCRKMTDDRKRCSAWKYYRKGGVGGGKLMTESNEYRFEFLRGRLTESAVALGSITEREGGGWGGAKLICRPRGLFFACSKVHKTL